MTVTEEVVVDSSFTVDSTEALAGVGDRLRAAREAAGMSCGDVAHALKFSPRQIELLESNAWSLLPGQTVIRGFVRNYARLLKLDPEPLLKELETAAMPKAAVLDLPRSTEATLPQQGRVQNRDYAAVAGALVLVLLAVFAYFFVPDDLWSGELAKLRAVLTESAEIRPPEVAAPAPVKDLLPPAADVAAPGAAAPGAESAPQAVPATPAMATGPLRIEFDKASWIEVRDGKGAVVLSQQGAAGTARDLEGDPPFSIVIGDGRHVRLTYRDHPIDLGPFINVQSNVARLTIE